MQARICQPFHGLNIANGQVMLLKEGSDEPDITFTSTSVSVLSIRATAVRAPSPDLKAVPTHVSHTPGSALFESIRNDADGRGYTSGCFYGLELLLMFHEFGHIGTYFGGSPSARKETNAALRRHFGPTPENNENLYTSVLTFGTRSQKSGDFRWHTPAFRLTDLNWFRNGRFEAEIEQFDNAPETEMPFPKMTKKNLEKALNKIKGTFNSLRMHGADKAVLDAAEEFFYANLRDAIEPRWNDKGARTGRMSGREFNNTLLSSVAAEEFAGDEFDDDRFDVLFDGLFGEDADPLR